MNAGWQKKTLGEVLVKTKMIDPLCSPQDEFDYIDVSSVSNKTLKIEETQRLKGKDAPSRARRLVRAHDVLFATVRPTLRRIAIVPDELDKQVCSTGYFVLRPQPQVDYRFVFYFLQTDDFISEMEKLQKGASYPAVTDGNVRSQKIFVPPLPEQERIVGILDEAFEGIATARASAEKNLQKVRELFESYLDSVFANPGEDWEVKKLGELCEVLDSKRKPITKRDRTSGKYPYYGATGILDYVHDYIFNEKLILIGEDGAKWGPGENTAFIAEGKYWVNNHAHVIRPNRMMVLDNWIVYFLNFSDLLKYITGLTVSKLNQEKMRGIIIPLPPLPEQQIIVAKLDALSAEAKKLEALYQQKLDTLEELKKSLLYEAFSGEM